MRVTRDDKARVELRGLNGDKLILSYKNNEVDDEYVEGAALTWMEMESWEGRISVELYGHEVDTLLETLAKIRGRTVS